MRFKTLDEATLLKYLKDEPDMITPAFNAHQEYFKSLSCHRCGSPVVAVINSRMPFRASDLLPNYLARCKDCECEFEPYTKIEVTLPKQPHQEV